MNRRGYLRGLAAGGTTSILAGCLGGLGGDSSPNTYLGEPEGERPDSADLPYPAWGQELPGVTLPAPLSGETVTTSSFEGERNVMLACFYTHCPNVCQQMIGQMRNVQADAIENGYADEVEFVESIPRTSTGKFDKKVLRDQYDHVTLTEGETGD